MQYRTIWTGILSTTLLLALPANATSVPSLSFEEITDRSELVVEGRITRSWTDWDQGHKFIWTHYELSVSSAHKGSPGRVVVLSEPGGVVGIRGMAIAGSVLYQAGDRVLVFLERMPNGYLRTTGWSQGKYTIDESGRLHAEATLRGRSLEGMSVAELHGQVARRIQ